MCEFNITTDNYLNWFSDTLDIGEIPYSFEFILSVAMYNVNNTNRSQPYNAIIEQSTFLMCSPLYRYVCMYLCMYVCMCFVIIYFSIHTYAYVYALD